jgi:hypothetical protein
MVVGDGPLAGFVRFLATLGLLVIFAFGVAVGWVIFG